MVSLFRSQLAATGRAFQRCAIRSLSFPPLQNPTTQLRHSAPAGLSWRGERIATGPQQEKKKGQSGVAGAETLRSRFGLSRCAHYPKGNVGSPTLLITHFLHTLASVTGPAVCVMHMSARVPSLIRTATTCTRGQPGLIRTSKGSLVISAN